MIDEILYENSSLNENAYLLKLNNEGNLDWIKWLFNYDKFDENKEYIPRAYIANIFIDENYNVYINGYTNAKQLYLNNDIIVSKNNNNDNAFIIKYNLNKIAQLENIKLYLLITDNNFAYKYFFYMLVRIILLMMFIYIIWLIYESTTA